MNHREPPHPTAGVRKAKLCLALLVLSSLAPTGAQAALRKPVPPKADPASYLPAIAAPALRFQAAPPPREQITKIALAKPAPKPVTLIESSIPRASDAIARAAADAKAAAADKTDTKPATTTPAKTPSQIIPDEIRPSVHPEDFIPFFQIPGSARAPANVNVIVPAIPSVPTPAALPSSSATYRQTP